MTDNPLTHLKENIEQHWRTYLPRMTAMLEAEGGLQEAIENAAKQTEDAVLNAISTGTPLWEAWPIFREQWAFLLAEEGYDALSDDEDDENNVPEENWLEALGFSGPEDWANPTDWANPADWGADDTEDDDELY